jgi:hypothetical protein
MDESFVTFRVAYEDLPDMIELAIDLRHGGWSASTGIYVSPTLLADDAASLIDWSRNPIEPLRFGSGINPGGGGFVMQFRTVNAAQHVRCLFQLVTRELNRNPAWQVVVEIPTELGLVERFGEECIALGQTFRGESRLTGLPT